VEGIPTTALPRTFLDLAAVAPRRLKRAVQRSEELGTFDFREVESAMIRCSGHRGASRLRRELAAYHEPAFTRSGLEQRFLELVRRAGLPRPAANHFVAGYEVDMYWGP
jgi:hypothetical protein